MWWGAYIGLPFEAANCWALVRRVYHDRLGIDLPEYGEISARDLVRVARAMDAGAAQECWRSVRVPREFDVVLMRRGRAVVHVGVMTGPRYLLHTELATDAVHVPLSHPSVAGRVVGYRRHAA